MAIRPQGTTFLIPDTKHKTENWLLKHGLCITQFTLITHSATRICLVYRLAPVTHFVAAAIP